MRLNSVYCADCICGRHFETQFGDYICPDCQRHIVIEWEIERERRDPAIEPPSMSKTEGVV
jgi:hypothetical protein